MLNFDTSINILRMGTRGVRQTQAVRPRAADRRKRSDPATTPARLRNAD
ncbi:MAG: hypothetical protein F6K24_50195, partial [Okeania sp. SIO2D1]|nr:hypothetical protein [Okeania sp. SIO2D1]